ncbi:NnrS family protein [Stutzerimonas xanthomarina]|uniref:NnrS family protein n=1 Tax=Stutzerimonas xanthomarina TaxID=271420 RepID=UPI003AA8C992
MAPRKPRLPFANAWFFPAAALYAALILPWSVLTMLGLAPALPGLATPAGHAHEMLFGYALAVVAGYLLGPQPQRITLALLGCWLAARAGFLLAPDAWYAVGADLLFVAGLLWKVVPRFLGAAKKWRNQTVAPVVIGLGVTSLLANAGAGSSLRLREPALMLFAALMFFMGGRIIAPALAGHAQSEGRRLDARVQPQLEGGVLILLGIAFGSSLLPWTLLGQVAGAVLVAAGVLGAIRLLRWQPWHYRTRPDLLVLLVGYSWLSLGLVLLGVVMSGPWLPVSATLHVLTIGALGSLTFGVMVRTRLLYRFRDANAQPWIHPFALLISAATLARVLPPLLGIESGLWLLIAAACWSSAFIALVVSLWRTRMPPRPRSPSAV